MKINIQNSKSGDVIFIRAGESLDSTAYNTFGEAASLAISLPSSKAIVLDLGRTLQLPDSGRAILMTLYLRAGRLKNKLYITNANPKIHDKLYRGKISRLFNMNKDWQEYKIA